MVLEEEREDLARSEQLKNQIVRRLTRLKGERDQANVQNMNELVQRYLREDFKSEKAVERESVMSSLASEINHLGVVRIDLGHQVKAKRDRMRRNEHKHEELRRTKQASLEEIKGGLTRGAAAEKQPDRVRKAAPVPGTAEEPDRAARPGRRNEATDPSKRGRGAALGGGTGPGSGRGGACGAAAGGGVTRWRSTGPACRRCARNCRSCLTRT